MRTQPERQSPPAANRGASNVTEGDSTNVPQAADRSAQAQARRRWARSLIRRATSPAPTYGSAAWLALPEGSPEKIKAVVVAAECWAVDGDDIETRLRREIDAARAAEDRRWDQLHAESVEMVQRLAKRPHIGSSYAERRARELADAKQPRPGDFPGQVGAA